MSLSCPYLPATQFLEVTTIFWKLRNILSSPIKKNVYILTLIFDMYHLI